jgi:hypothetical protein
LLSRIHLDCSNCALAIRHPYTVTENTDPNFGHVQPTRMLGCVMKLHTTQKFGGRALSQRIIKTFSELRIEIVQRYWLGTIVFKPMLFFTT